MKKILLIVGIFVASFASASAQTQSEDLQKQMDQLTQEMQQLMGEFQNLMGESLMLSDTLMKGFQPLAENLQSFENIPADSMTLNKMMDMMQAQISQLSQQDWSALQRMMEEFAPNMTIPNQKDNTKKKKKTTDI